MDAGEVAELALVELLGETSCADTGAAVAVTVTQRRFFRLRLGPAFLDDEPGFGIAVPCRRIIRRVLRFVVPGVGLRLGLRFGFRWACPGAARSFRHRRLGGWWRCSLLPSVSDPAGVGFLDQLLVMGDGAVPDLELLLVFGRHGPGTFEPGEDAGLGDGTGRLIGIAFVGEALEVGNQIADAAHGHLGDDRFGVHGHQARRTDSIPARSAVRPRRGDACLARAADPMPGG